MNGTAVEVVLAGETVVVEQRARWSASDTDQQVASLFAVRDGTVARVVRYEDLGAALVAAGLQLADQI